MRNKLRSELDFVNDKRDHFKKRSKLKKNYTIDQEKLINNNKIHVVMLSRP